MAQQAAKKITDKIIGSEVVKEQEDKSVKTEQQAKAEIVQMHEKIERGEVIDGSTYKIKTPLDEHAIYVTINDVVLNEGTDNEVVRPFEIFINSKNMQNFQWVVALTRLVSAVFRKGGDVTFLVEELQSVFDPKGGYFKKGGKYTPSLVAEIGDAIEAHLKKIGLIEDKQLTKEQQALVDEKLAKHNAQNNAEEQTESPYPANATLCEKCHTKAVVHDGGCETCLSCSHSRCT